MEKEVSGDSQTRSFRIAFPPHLTGLSARIWHKLHRSCGLHTLRGSLRFYAVLLVCLPLALAVMLFSLFGRERLLHGELRQLAANLGYERNVVRSWLDDRLGDAAFLAGLDAAHNRDQKALGAIFSVYMNTHRYVTAVVYVSPDGYTVVDPSREPGVYVGDRDYFQEARHGRTTVTGLLASRVTGQPMCVVSVPVTDARGNFGGAIFMPVEMRSLDALLGETGFGRHGSVYLTDVAGRVLAPAMPIPDAGDWPMVEAALLGTGAQGSMYRDATGREMLGACVDLDIQGWRLVRRESTDNALAGFGRQIVWVAGGALATLLLLTPLLLRLCRNLERPLETLSRYARDLHSSRYNATCDPIAPQSMPQEMGQLYEAFCGMASDVRLHIEATERLSIQDHLTGIYNRRFLYAGGTKLLEAARRSERPCACLMIDVDHFKAVNDTYGHQTGDVVLHHVAQTIVHCVRKADIVARYGGEEFAVLLTGAGLREAMRLGERIRRTLAERPCPISTGSLYVTVSIGVAQARTEVLFGGTVLDDLLARSDAAMYAAKTAGRNRVIAEEDSSEAPPTAGMG